MKKTAGITTVVGTGFVAVVAAVGTVVGFLVMNGVLTVRAGVGNGLTAAGV